MLNQSESHRSKMLKTYWRVVCLSLMCTLGSAQVVEYSFPFDMPDGVVGQPYTLFDITDPGADLEGVTVTFTASGNVPPGLTAAPFFRLFGTPTTPGTYRFDLILTATASEGGNTVTVRITYNSTLVIRHSTGPPVTLDPPSQTISSTLTGGPQSRSLVLSNRSAQARSFTATSSTGTARNWLSVEGGGSLAPFSSSSLSITADPQALGVGTYSGTVSISISPTGERLTAVVLFTVTGSQQNLVLSQSGLTLQTVQGGVSPPPLSFSVFNESSGSIAWSAAASTISGGNWLTITPNNGTSTNTQGREIQVRVSPGSLAPGDYYGQVEVRAPGAANSPQIVGVVMNVVPPGQIQGTVVSPTGLVFVGTQGSANPPPQTVTLSGLTNAAITYQASAITDGTQA